MVPAESASSAGEHPEKLTFADAEMADLRLYLTLACAVVLAGAGFAGASIVLFQGGITKNACPGFPTHE